MFEGYQGFTFDHIKLRQHLSESKFSSAETIHLDSGREAKNSTLGPPAGYRTREVTWSGRDQDWFPIGERRVVYFATTPSRALKCMTVTLEKLYSL